MGAFYSPTDDNSDYGQPGVHLVIGNIKEKSYSVCGSISQRHTRFHMNAECFVELDRQATTTFHPKAFEYVQLPTYQAPVKTFAPAKTAELDTHYDFDDYSATPRNTTTIAKHVEDDELMTISDFFIEYENGAKTEDLKRILENNQALRDEVTDLIYTISDFVYDDD